MGCVQCGVCTVWGVQCGGVYSVLISGVCTVYKANT